MTKIDLKVMNQDDDFANLSACERCVADGGGCCTGSGSGIFTTMHDVLRIHKAKGIPLHEIAFFGKVDAKHEKNVKETDPFLYQFYRNSSVLQLKRKNGFCHFLVDGEGCTVWNSRPAICRLFPFTFDFKKGDGSVKIIIPKADKKDDEDCTILAENFYRSKGANFKAMNTTREKLEKLAKQHVEEIKIYGTYVDDLAAGVSFDEIVRKYNLHL